MAKLWYIDIRGDYHNFEMERETLKNIFTEFGSVGDYLKNLGVCFKVCGSN